MQRRSLEALWRASNRSYAVELYRFLCSGLPRDWHGTGRLGQKGTPGIAGGGIFLPVRVLMCSGGERVHAQTTTHAFVFVGWSVAGSAKHPSIVRVYARNGGGLGESAQRAKERGRERERKRGMQEAQHKTSSSETTHSRIVHISGVKPLTMGGLVKEAYWQDDSWFSGQICLSTFRNGLWSASVWHCPPGGQLKHWTSKPAWECTCRLCRMCHFRRMGFLWIPEKCISLNIYCC